MELTTLARTKTYLGNVAGTNADAVLTQLIAQMSGQITSYCSRSFARVVNTAARLNGNGGQRLYMPNTPLISVVSLSIGNVPVAASTDGVEYGYQYDTTMLYLFGYVFYRGLRNVLVSYVAGYAGEQNSYVPAAPGPYTVTPTTGDTDGRDGAVLATADRGVVYTATGAALVAVGSAPTVGQYSFSGGVYTFAAADAGAQVTMSYDYVPGAVEMACIEMVGAELKRRDNLGIQSRSMQNENISYSDKSMSAAVKSMLAPYNKRNPV